MQRIWRHCLESQRESESILSYKESMEDSGNQQKHNYDSWSYVWLGQVFR